MDNKIGLVFIHGAGLNASIWDKLKERIKAPVLAIDFPNRKTNGKENYSLTFEEETGIIPSLLSLPTQLEHV